MAVKSPCGAEPLFIARLQYGNISYRVSVHHPLEDNVISKTLLMGTLKYGSISEVHSICQNSGKDVGGGMYHIDCGMGKLFVEVRSFSSKCPRPLWGDQPFFDWLTPRFEGWECAGSCEHVSGR